MYGSKKNVAFISIAAVLVVALVVVAALAIAGVFNPFVDEPVAFAATEQENVQLVRDFAPDTVLYLRSLDGTEPTGVPGTYVKVVDNEGENVPLVFATQRKDGHVGVLPKNGWTPGMTYGVSILSGSFVFADGEYAGLSSFQCTVTAPESEVAVFKEGILYLSAEDTLVETEWADAAHEEPIAWELAMSKDPGDSKVFVLGEGAKSVAYKRHELQSEVRLNGGKYVLTVQAAEVEDVFASLNINKSYVPTAEDILFDVDATVASFKDSEFYAAALGLLYGSVTAEEKKEAEKWVDFKVDPAFKMGPPAQVTVDLTVVFKGILKKNGVRDPESKITIKVANVLEPTFDVHIEKEEGSGKNAFDVAVDLDLTTHASIVASYQRSGSSKGENPDQDLKKIAEELQNVARKYLGEHAAYNPEKPYVFAHWTIPVGNLPICIEYDMGLEIKANFSAEIGTTMSNELELTFGAVYANGQLQPFGNVEDKFSLDTISLKGSLGASIGLLNEIGVSAYGTIGVSLSATVGAYGEIAGRLDVDVNNLMQGDVDIVPAYYIEAGLFVNLKVKGKVFGFTIKEFTALDKKFPLLTLGHKYIPISSDFEGWPTTDGATPAENPFADETVYMNSSYFYVTAFDVMALDITSIYAPAEKRTLAWDEFTYSYDEAYFTMEGNKIKVQHTAPAEFESVIVVTSKVNKDLSKKLTVVKNPEVPTTVKGGEVKVYDKANPQDVYYTVMMNGSKFLGVSLDGEPLHISEDTYAFDTLVLDVAVLNGLTYGEHEVLVESSRGYLALTLDVISSADVEIDTTKRVFDKASARALSWNVDLQGSDILSLNAEYQYRAMSGVLSVGADHWMALDCGEYELELVLSNGNEFVLPVEVVDNRSAVLNTAVYEYVAGSGASLALDIELYEKEIQKVSFGGTVYGVDALEGEKDNVLPADAFAGLGKGSYQGQIVAGATYSFTVEISEDNQLIVPVKYATFDKAVDGDVVFKANASGFSGLYLVDEAGNLVDGFAVEGDDLVVSAAYLKTVNVNSWIGKVMGQGVKAVSLRIDLSNSARPVLVGAASVTTANSTASFGWDLAGYSFNDLSVEGLAADAYLLKDNGIDVKVSELVYGENRFVVYTPVNSFELVVVKKGNPALLTHACTVDKEAGDEASFAIDVAHLTFREMRVEGVEILPIQYRYHEGVVTLTNDFVYNLEAGKTYNVILMMSEGVEFRATLSIQGKLDSFQAIGDGKKATPYLIYTADQLINMAEQVNNGVGKDAYYRLMADVDMTGKEMAPIGTDKNAFGGEFDGNGYSIYNLSITKTVKIEDGHVIGLFGYNAGTVKNVRLVSPVVKFADAGSVNAGILVGRNTGTIRNITIVTGTISAESKSWLNLKNAFFDLGAVVGYNENGTIKNVQVEASISAKVKGLNIMGIQVTGRKSYINVGAVVGYFTKTDAALNGKKLVSAVTVNATISAEADNNQINKNGWYGFSDLSENEIDSSSNRMRIYTE